MQEIIFIGVDVQVDFIDGALPNEVAQANVNMVNTSAKDARDRGAKVIWTQDTHLPAEEYLKTLEGQKLPVPHCARDTDGWMIHHVIEPGENDMFVEKPTFGSVELMEALRDHLKHHNKKDFKAIFLCGYCSNICGVSNALLARAFFPNTRIYWLAYAGAGVIPALNSAALSVMESCQVDIILTYDDYVQILDKIAKEG